MKKKSKRARKAKKVASKPAIYKNAYHDQASGREIAGTGGFSRMAEYIRNGLLCPIKNRSDYEEALETVEEYGSRDDLSRVQKICLESLVTLIEAYEKKNFPIDVDDVTPLEALKFLVKENEMSGSDLGRILGQRELGAKILNGSRKLSKSHIKILAKHFLVSPALFI